MLRYHTLIGTVRERNSNPYVVTMIQPVLHIIVGSYCELLSIHEGINENYDNDVDNGINDEKKIKNLKKLMTQDDDED